MTQFVYYGTSLLGLLTMWKKKRATFKTLRVYYPCFQNKISPRYKFTSEVDHLITMTLD